MVKIIKSNSLVFKIKLELNEKLISKNSIFKSTMENKSIVHSNFFRKRFVIKSMNPLTKDVTLFEYVVSNGRTDIFS